MSNLIDHDSPFLNDLDFDNLSILDQANIDALIEASSIMIERACNRIFAQADYEDEELSGDDLDSIFVKNPPLNSLDTVKIVVPYQITNLEFSSENFDTNLRIGRIKWKSPQRIASLPSDYLGYFPKDRDNILVSYNGGFEEVPAPIQKLCADMVKNCFSPGQVPENIESEKLGQYFVKYKKDVLEKSLISNKSIISLYKIHKV